MASLRDELRKIHDANGKQLTPEAVVKAARPAKHPLHNRFEWDDTKAGHLYRLHQAAELIRSVKVEYARDRNGPKTVREYTSTYEVGSSRPGVYRATEDVVQDEISHAILLRNLEREIADLKRRYGHLKEFGDLMRRGAA